MRIPLYQIDAFTREAFSGNPAAVCPLQSWLDEQTMQAIAQENNLSETAFFVRAGDEYGLRWFTPLAEVELCGHATLASAYVIFHCLGQARETVTFNTRSGKLTVRQNGELLEMDFPAQPPTPCAAPTELIAGLKEPPIKVLRSANYLAVYDSEQEVGSLQPDMKLLRELGKYGVIVTAKGEESDFVSRYFAPQYGIDEDPVTGSTHCTLTPFWSKELGKAKMVARQVSARGGELFCEDRGERVLISGHAVKVLEGHFSLPGLAGYQWTQMNVS